MSKGAPVRATGGCEEFASRNASRESATAPIQRYRVMRTKVKTFSANLRTCICKKSLYLCLRYAYRSHRGLLGLRSAAKRSDREKAGTTCSASTCAAARQTRRPLCPLCPPCPPSSARCRTRQVPPSSLYASLPARPSQSQSIKLALPTNRQVSPPEDPRRIRSSFLVNLL